MGQIVERVVSRHSTHSHVNSLSQGQSTSESRCLTWNLNLHMPYQAKYFDIGKTVANRTENLDPEKTSPTGVSLLPSVSDMKRKTIDNLNAAINIRKGLHNLQTRVFEAYGEKLLVEFL